MPLKSYAVLDHFLIVHYCLMNFVQVVVVVVVGVVALATLVEKQDTFQEIALLEDHQEVLSSISFLSVCVCIS